MRYYNTPVAKKIWHDQKYGSQLLGIDYGSKWMTKIPAQGAEPEKTGWGYIIMEINMKKF